MGFFDGIADFVSAPFKSVFSGNNTGGFGSTGFLFGKGSLTELFNNPSSWWETFKNGETNNINKQIADQNLGFQRENLDYQKALQQKIFEREDNSYQRTANDMRLAGLNPLSMSGTNGAGEAIPTEPLHNDFNYTDSGNMAALGQIFNVINQMRTTQSNSSLQSAQANLLNAQAENQEVKNLYEQSFLENNLRFLRQNLLNAQKTGTGIDWDNKLKELNKKSGDLDYFSKQKNVEFNQIYGFTDNMPELLKAYGLYTGKKIYNYGSKGTHGLEGLEFNDSMLNRADIATALMSSKILTTLLGMVNIGLFPSGK